MSDELRTSTLPPVDGYPIALATPADHAIGAELPICSALEKLAGDNRVRRSTLLGMPWLSPIIGSGCLDLGDGPDLDPSALRGLRGAIDSVVPDPARAAELEGSVRSFVDGLIETRAPGMRLASSASSGRDHLSKGGAGTRLVVVAALLTRAFHQGSLLVDRPIGPRFLTTEVTLPSESLGVPDADLRQCLRDLVVQLSEPAHISQLAGYWKDEGFWSALMDHLVRQLDRPASKNLSSKDLYGKVSGFDVQLLTEFAWLLIVKDSALYPGWSDLLVGLMGSRAEDLRGNRQTPKKLTSSIAEEVEQLLEPATSESWQSWLGVCDPAGRTLPPAIEEVPVDRRAFYSRIAHLLTTQAELRKVLHPAQSALDEDDDDYYERSEAAEEAEERATETRWRLTNELSDRLRAANAGSFGDTSWPIPQATAIVTSFDIELEMAFWAAQQRFVVVVPMLASSTEPNHPGRVVWLAAMFDPSDRASEKDLAAFRQMHSQPGDGDAQLGRLEELAHLRHGRRTWLPAWETGSAGPSGDWSNLPTIIRLSGAPLLKVSKADVDPRVRSYASLSLKHDYRLIPALTIDEYSSLRLSAHEVYSLASRNGLPPRMVNDTDAMSRVWVSFGVQMDDPATRSRLFSQLSVAAIAPTLDLQARDDQTVGSGGGGTPGPAGGVGIPPDRSMRMATGLAINRRFNDADTAIMRWLGFEFAQVEVKSLVADVDHYTRDHLKWALEQLRSDELSEWPLDPDADVSQIPWLDWHRASDTGCEHLPSERPR